MSKGCHVVCCPSCGYSFPQEGAGLAGGLRKLLDRFKTEKDRKERVPTP
jgi:hypothetical protein